MPKRKSYRKVSIIVLNWNGKHYLKMCLPSLKKLDYPNYEVVVVDNASKDGSQVYVRKYHPWVKLIENKENLGCSGGNNIGVEQSDGDYFVVCNNDVEVEPDFLSILVKRIESDKKIGCVQPKLRTYDNKNLLDSAGSFLTDTPFLHHYGRLKREDLPIYNKSMEIFSAKGAVTLYRRNLVEKVGGLFDPDFFIFFEDTDLCHRLWLGGYRVVYEPKSVIYHVVSGDTSKQFKSDQTLYLSLRNRVCSFIKNFELGNLIKMLFILFAVYSTLAFIYLITFKFSLAWAILRGVGWNFKKLPQTLKKRKFLQGKVRKVSDKTLFKKLKKNPPLSYYLYLFRNSLGEFQDINI